MMECPAAVSKSSGSQESRDDGNTSLEVGKVEERETTSLTGDQNGLDNSDVREKSPSVASVRALQRETDPRLNSEIPVSVFLRDKINEKLPDKERFQVRCIVVGAVMAEECGVFSEGEALEELQTNNDCPGLQSSNCRATEQQNQSSQPSESLKETIFPGKQESVGSKKEASSISFREQTFSSLRSSDSPCAAPEHMNVTIEGPMALSYSRSLQSTFSVLNLSSPRANIPEGEGGKNSKRKVRKVSFLPVKYVQDSAVDLEKGLRENASARDDSGKGSKKIAVTVDAEQVCRVCHLNSECKSGALDLVHIGCGCKDDLGLAHRHCAEAWFKIRGNRTCEICGETAKNIMGSGDAEFMEEWNDRESNAMDDERQRCWRSRPLCNFLLACMVVAFILPWFFRVSMF